ncbi:hypothetical protein HYALB_00007125 [Hymenoscyphus albidus]|uniref:Zn(2)-C6 fungal-type domain-containing protein n=1 Tax=Hymenoscyphus albidus TaxID=595503 RepID=A0A9N9LGN9_9HELO|nr:hypothetical protein HYALB_00007125 [Hymenoscyphus albidus]
MENNPITIETPKRKRAFLPKSRSGCKTCKIRRVKCDEQKPSCARCIHSGRACDGYAPSRLPPLQVPTMVLASMSAGTRADPVNSLLPYHLFHNPQERRAFDFFLKCTVSQLSCVIRSDFWTRDVLQAAHHEAAIKYAVVALGSLHEGCVRGESRISWEGEEGNRLGFATGQYIKAIGHFCDPKRKEKKRLDVALITCILFICFELLRCQLNSALSHINGGVKILKELQSSNSLTIPAQSYVPVSTLRNIFKRLDSQASQLSFGRRRHLLSEHSKTKLAHDLKFESLEDARNALDDIWGSATLHIATSPPPNVPPDEARKNLAAMQNLIYEELEIWSRSFGVLVNYLKSKGNLDGPTQNSVNTMELQWKQIGLLRQTDAALMVEDEMFWDGFAHEYEVMLSMAEYIIASTPPSTSRPITKPTSVKTETRGEELLFYLDNSVLFPLFFIAVKSRDRILRRKALTALEQANRQEGVWNSNFLASVARKVIDIEEEGLAEEELERIPRERRVWRVSGLFNGAPRNAKMVFVRVARPQVEEYIDW